MTPTETLKHEHQIILLVLEAARREALLIQNTGKIRGDDIGSMIDFFQNFVDRCHHTKEEHYLFAALRAHGVPDNEGALFYMWKEHDEGRRQVTKILSSLPGAQAGEPAALAEAAANLLAFVELLKKHIDMEDNVLYPMADNLLTPKEQDELGRSFEKVEAEEMGPGVHEKYHQLAHQLTEKFSI
jgi:hemerythrin-like domain-containing protein